MSDQISVKPTPIQRNAHDVAIELLNLHIANVAIDYSVEGLQELYSKFYSTARALEHVNPEYLKEYTTGKLNEVLKDF